MGDALPIGDAEAAALFAELDSASGLLLAISGGADSTALMLLMARWVATAGRPPLHVVTIDHAVREASATEAAMVVAWAEKLGLSADVLRLTPPKTGDHATLRDARYAKLAEAARRRGASHVVTAHHRDDQAETVLLRLARGSGLRGLRGMLAMRTLCDDGVSLVRLARPLIAVHPDRLRATCEAAGHAWLDDPSNSDPRYARAQLRAIRPDLDGLGLTADRLVAAAETFSQANAALDHYAADALQALMVTPVGLVGLPRARLDAPDAVARRIVEALLDIVRGGLPYPPRLERVLRIERWLRDGGTGRRVLQGCVITAPQGDGPVTVHREWGREGLAGFELEPSAVRTFDNRFVIEGGPRRSMIRAGKPSQALERPVWAAAQAWREACMAAPMWDDGERQGPLLSDAAGQAPLVVRDRVKATWEAALAAVGKG